MLATYKNIKTNASQQRFSMPLSLRYIKELASAGVDWHGLHIIDLTSLIYSLRIDNARQYLERKRQEQLSRRGIRNVQSATAADFDAL